MIWFIVVLLFTVGIIVGAWLNTDDWFARVIVLLIAGGPFIAWFLMMIPEWVRML